MQEKQIFEENLSTFKLGVCFRHSSQLFCAWTAVRPGRGPSQGQVYIFVSIYSCICICIMSPCSFLIGIFGGGSTLGTCSWKNEHGGLRIRSHLAFFQSGSPSQTIMLTRGKTSVRMAVQPRRIQLFEVRCPLRGIPFLHRSSV